MTESPQMTKLEPAQQFAERILNELTILDHVEPSSAAQAANYRDGKHLAALIESDRAAAVGEAMVDLKEWIDQRMEEAVTVRELQGRFSLEARSMIRLYECALADVLTKIDALAKGGK